MSFFFILHESPLQQSDFAFASVLAVVSAATTVPACFNWHESPLQQHDSIEQQASAFFFCSPCEGVCAVTAANATSNKPRSRMRRVFFRGFIVVLLYLRIEILHAGQKRTSTRLN